MKARAMIAFLAVVGSALAMLGPSAAHAGGSNLGWDDCLGAGGRINRNFACDTLSGDRSLFVSFEPNAGLTALVGCTVVINLISSSSPLPAWWQFKNPGSCRQLSLSARTDFPATCLDPWQGQGTAEVLAYFVSANTPSLPTNRARIVASVSVPTAQAAVVDPGTEYFALRLRIDNIGTVGPGACIGCFDPVCIVLNEVMLVQPPDTPGGSPILNNPLLSHYVTWQGGAINSFGCPGGSPTVNRTWGQVKGLYR